MNLTRMGGLNSLAGKTNIFPIPKVARRSHKNPVFFDFPKYLAKANGQIGPGSEDSALNFFALKTVQSR